MILLVEIFNPRLEVAGENNDFVVLSEMANQFLHGRLCDVGVKPEMLKVRHQLFFDAELGAGEVPELVARVFSLAIGEAFLGRAAAEDFLDALFGSGNELGNFIDKGLRSRSEIDTAQVHDDEFYHGIDRNVVV